MKLLHDIGLTRADLRALGGSGSPYVIPSLIAALGRLRVAWGAAEPEDRRQIERAIRTVLATPILKPHGRIAVKVLLYGHVQREAMLKAVRP